MWHRGWWFVARPGQARPGQSSLNGTESAEGLAHLQSHKALDYVRVNPCTPVDRKVYRCKEVGSLSNSPAVKLRPQRCAAQANSFVFLCFEAMQF